MSKAKPIVFHSSIQGSGDFGLQKQQILRIT